VSGVEEVARIVAQGGVVAIPTDTVYGLACHPDDARAAERIFQIKRRPPGMELSLLAATREDAERFADLEAPPAQRLAGRFWPGALSLIVPLRPPRHPAIPRQGDTIMVRVPGHPLTRALLATTGPLASTSANRHGEPPATTAAEARQLPVDAVLDGGPAAGQASTIIDCSVMPPRVLRAGPLGADELSPYLEGSS
jgi:tRNA threonylcarbamoyl adenosine modification protein (Sua5/YciO/YrdC/YwlC family)